MSSILVKCPVLDLLANVNTHINVSALHQYDCTYVPGSIR